jgi:GDPmannose 4,6-dehydratase
MAFGEIGIAVAFKGEQEQEVGYVEAIDAALLEARGIKSCTLKTGDTIVAVDPRYYRPTEVELLIGDPTKSQTKLGWKPKYDLAMLVEDMMESDLKLMQRELFLKQSGHKVIAQFE